MAIQATFHDGELAVQERAGALAHGRNSGRVIADALIPGALKFIRNQQMVIAGSVDLSGNVWASILIGRPGFLRAEPRSIEIDLSSSERNPHDPIWTNLANDPRVGLLVIDLSSRARLRVNGRLETRGRMRLHVVVESAYPNCPKYIQRRVLRPALNTDARSEISSRTGRVLEDQQVDWIAGADTFFVASNHPGNGVDASHRGGNPGFIQVLGSNRLRIPDYVGNGMFNTLGNFSINPRAGLLFTEFDSGHTLQLTGRAEILWDVHGSEDLTGGTNRFWEFTVEQWKQSDHALHGSVEFLDYSSHNPDHVLGPR